jgi:hypothetical protein
MNFVMADTIFFTIGAICFATMAGGCYVLMGTELNRKGRPTKYLSLSFNLTERIRLVKVVFKNYSQLKQDENKTTVLPLLLWASVAFCVLCLVFSMVTLLI